MADAASNVELFLNGELPASVLHDSLEALRRGMRSCKERQLWPGRPVPQPRRSVCPVPLSVQG